MKTFAILVALLAAPFAAAYTGSSFAGSSLGVSATNAGKNSMAMEYIRKSKSHSYYIGWLFIITQV
jgi:hypothetical protein